MYVKWIEDLHKDPRLREDWNSLTGGVPFRRWEWLASWWDQYGQATQHDRPVGQLLVLGVYESEERQDLLGLAPLYIDPSWTGGRVIRFLADGEVCTDYLSILSRSGQEKNVSAAFAGWLTDEADDLWDAIELSGIDGNDCAMAAFSDQLALHGHDVYTRLGHRCWRIELPGSWEDYMAALSKSHRKHMRRAERRGTDTGLVRVRTVEPDQCEEAIGQLITLHQRRRASLGENGCFGAARFGRFLHQASRRMLDAGLLELNVLEFEGRPVAVDLNLAEDGVLYGYQSGLEPSALHIEPGRLLSIYSMRQAIQRGDRAYDLLRGDEPYKVQWRATPHGTLRMQCVRRKTSSRIRHAVWLAGHKVHDWRWQDAIRRGGRTRAAAFAAAARPTRTSHATLPKTSLSKSWRDDFRIRSVTTPGELEALREAWNAIATGSPLRRHEWLAAWWRHFGRQRDGDAARQLCVQVVEDADGKVIGVAPWYLAVSPALGHVIRFLGDGIVCTDYQTILCQRGRETEVAGALANWLSGTPDLEWNLLQLADVGDDDSAVAALVARLRESGYAIHQQAGVTCWRVCLPDSWEAYVQSLSSKMRAKVRQCQRKYFDSGRVQLHSLQNGEQLHEAFKLLRILHQKRRQSVGDAGCFSDPAFAGFLRDAAEGLLAAGRLEMLWLELDGRAVAVELNPSENGMMFSYQGGIEPDALRDRPGYLMNIARLQRAIERGDREFDFLRGDEPYKTHWNGRPVRLMEYRIRPNRTVDRMRHQVWLGAQQARVWAKHSLETARQWQQTAISACTALARIGTTKPSMGNGS